jgi:hypothetical protein
MARKEFRIKYTPCFSLAQALDIAASWQSWEEVEKKETRIIGSQPIVAFCSISGDGTLLDIRPAKPEDYGKKGSRFG